ncbi:hypothetical protein F5146DRAFT_664834 [Armillaria mellea]|nr:hypothetical protein F5146DRAFT_664834 [Armillaria mellea]
MTRSTGDSATSSYSFSQTHDDQMNPVVQRYDVDKPVEGVASPSEAGTRGLVNLQHSGLGTNDDTSSVPTLSSTQCSTSLADLTEIARSFQPQTELLNPCAKINEFILKTHLHVNVAITHSGEWSSALSHGDSDDSRVLPQVFFDYKVIIRDGVAILEAW